MGTPFKALTGVAAPLMEDDIDTDIIFPARFLLRMEKEGLDQYLFHDRRFDADGKVVADFILNRTPFDTATILIAGDNFGSGSSREHAVWSLAVYGIRCVIAGSFGEIFAANCIRNGILPAKVAHDRLQALAELAEQGPFTVDLQDTVIGLPNGTTVPFEIDASKREALLNGWDDIDQILAQDSNAIRAYEKDRSASQPWLFKDLTNDH